MSLSSFISVVHMICAKCNIDTYVYILNFLLYNFSTVEHLWRQLGVAG